MTAIITLTSDFGLADGYVAAMKGVMLGINPAACLVDICHTIEPQDITAAAFVVSTVYRTFPEGTVHLVVVDPGVGTERKGLVLKTPHACFVAPDNGVLSYVLQDYSSPNGKLGHGLEAVCLTNPEFRHEPVSSTFHGRDIFAPVAARLSLGVPIEQLGEKMTAINVLPIAAPQRGPDGSLRGAVIHVDYFGNLITNIRAEHLSGTTEALTVEIGAHRIKGLSRTYAQGNGLLALIGSSGHLEIALRDGNASRSLNVSVGETVTVTSVKQSGPGEVVPGTLAVF